jgi:hypothetical protein
MKTKKQRKASMVLGILSISLCWLTWPATILAIIGLCLPKSEQNRKRDITLNVVGLCLSVIWLCVAISMLGA